jgi:hypothetical protein
MKKLISMFVLAAALGIAGPASAWWFPPVVIPCDSVVAPAPLGLPPVACGPIHQGPWIWSPGPYVDGYGLTPNAFFPRPLALY